MPSPKSKPKNPDEVGPPTPPPPPAPPAIIGGPEGFGFLNFPDDTPLIRRNGVDVEAYPFLDMIAICETERHLQALIAYNKRIAEKVVS